MDIERLRKQQEANKLIAQEAVAHTRQSAVEHKAVAVACINKYDLPEEVENLLVRISTNNLTTADGYQQTVQELTESYDLSLESLSTIALLERRCIQLEDEIARLRNR